jgi:N-acetylglucosaminyldiphosphoundecaprenol N-acetyl-beta-D-mannosaminyltransferase
LNDISTETPAALRQSREPILGLPFFNGSASQAVAEMLSKGGLLVAPSGTCFERFLEDADYRRAIASADVILPDSGLMAELWHLLRGRRINRISGLAYLKHLLEAPAFRPDRRVWVLPNEKAQEKLLAWGLKEELSIDRADCYVAPFYQKTVEDDALLSLVEGHQTRHVIIAIGAGAQEKLGWYLRERGSVPRAIHCVGGALGFVTGDQVAIPDLADALYLGWFLRLCRQPRVFIPRLWKARVLPGLILRYGSKLPPMKSAETS